MRWPDLPWLSLLVCVTSTGLFPQSKCFAVDYSDVCAWLPRASIPRFSPADPTLGMPTVHGTPDCDELLHQPDVAIYAETIQPYPVRGLSVRMSLPSPTTSQVAGSHLFRLTLVNMTSNELIDSAMLCFNVVPPEGPASWEAAVNKDSDAVFASWPGCCPLPAFPLSSIGYEHAWNRVYELQGGDVRPIRLLWQSDTFPVGGIGRIVSQNLQWLDRSRVVIHTLRLSCEPSHQPSPYEHIVGSVSDIERVTACISCPHGVCSSLEDIQRILRSATTLSDIPSPISSSPDFTDFVQLIRGYDVFVSSENINHMEGILNLVRLANPALVRVADAQLNLDFPDRNGEHGYASRFPLDAVVALSVQHGMMPWNMPGSRLPVYVVPPAVDPAVFHVGAGVEGSGVLPEPYCGGSARRQRCEEDRDGDWCKEVFVFGFCARLSSEKGPALFMHAARVVEEQGLLPRAVFVILGSSHSKTFGNAMRALAQQYNVSRLIMLEGVSPDHMTSVYSCFDVLVSPYVNVLGESFAIANVEAMAMGIPVIHFNIGGMRDYSRHLVNCYVVSERSGPALAAGMVDLGRNVSLRQALSDGGVKTAREHYHPKTILQQHATAVFRQQAAAHRVSGVRIVVAQLTLGGLVCEGVGVEEYLCRLNIAEAGVIRVLGGVHVDSEKVPAGFDDVWASVLGASGDGEGMGLWRQRAAVALFLHWHRLRSQLCLLYSFLPVNGSVGLEPYEACSEDLRGFQDWPAFDVSVELPPMWRDSVAVDANGEVALTLHVSVIIRDVDDTSLVHGSSSPPLL